MDNGNIRFGGVSAADKDALRASGSLADRDRAPRPKLTFGSWPIIDERPRALTGEQCEANR